jgi:hypothetical protein
VRKILIIVVAMLMFVSAQAQPVDLKGGQVVNQGVCLHTDGKQYFCVAVVQGNKMYNVLLDEEGEAAIYSIDGGKAKLVWSRSAV